MIRPRMTDSDTRESLITICEVLKEEFLYLASLNSAMRSLFGALKQQLPNFEAHYKDQGASFGGTSPEMREKIEQLDALLQQLRKPV